MLLKKHLTEEGVSRLRPPAEGQVDYFDTVQRNLVLRLNYGGSKVWRARHYIRRKDKHGRRVSVPTSHGLGSYPEMKLKEARLAAKKFLADPAAYLAKSDVGSFKEIAENFVTRYVVAEKQLLSKREIERCLAKYVYPRWQRRPFREIKRSDVALLLDEIADENGARQADAVLAIIRKMTNWYASRNDDYASPVVKGMARSENGSRERMLDDAELRALWAAASASGTFGAMVKVLLLCAQRRDKVVVTMKWEDLTESGVWEIASRAGEKSNAGSLRLPQAALDIIHAQPRLAGNPYVFAAGKGKGSFNSFSQRKDELDAKLGKKMRPWVLHDLRRTARSLMSRAGVQSDVAERVLGHAIPGVRGIYDRHSYADEKAAALQALADLVDPITAR
jgi:integrase